MNNKLILIAGGTASGKTEIAINLRKSLKNLGFNSTIIYTDYYYRPLSEHKEKDNDKVNWDDPNSVNWKDLKNDLKSIFLGKTIKRNVYDFNSSNYKKDEFKIFKPNDYIILEGIFALYDKEIFENSYLKIFVHTDSDIRLIRRIQRDREKRYENFDMDVFFKRWKTQINPMHKLHIEPSKFNSDLIIMNNEDSKENTELIINNILSISRKN